LKTRLGEAGFVQQLDVDPCLFISDKVIMILFVDDSLLFAKTQKDLDEALVKLRSMGLALELEDDVGGFLGVKIDRSIPGEVTMTQTGLIDKIIADLHIEDLPPVDTPATGVLGTDPDGDPIDDFFIPEYYWRPMVSFLPFPTRHPIRSKSMFSLLLQYEAQPRTCTD
jgi:hypothetical protein